MNTSKRTGSKSFVINMTSCVVYRLLQMSVLVWVNQYLLKRIPTEEYSVYPLVLSMVVFGDFFKSIFTSGISRFLVAAHAKGDREEVALIASSMFPVLLGVGLTITGAAAFAAWRIDWFLDVDPAYIPQARLMLLLLAVMMGVNVATTPFQSGLLVQQKFVAINLIDLGTEILRVTVLLVLLLGVSTEVLWLVVASVVAGLANTLCQIIATRRTMPEVRYERRLVSRAQVKILLSFSAWSCTEGFSGVAGRSLPLMFLSRFAGALDVTRFHLANLADLQIKRLLAAAMRPAMPAMTSLYALGKNDQLKELYYSGGRYHLWIMLVPAGPLLAFSTDFMGLYAGSQFSDAGYVVMAFFLRYLVIYASAMYYRIAHASGDIKVYYITDAISQGLVIALTYYVLRFRGGGVVEMAWWTCIAQSIYNMVVVWPLGIKSVAGNWADFFKKTLFPGWLPFAVSALYCIALKHFHTPDNWSSMIMACGSGAVVNFVTILLVSPMTGDGARISSAIGAMRRKLSFLNA